MIEAYYNYYTKNEYEMVYDAVKKANNGSVVISADMLNNKYHDMRSGSSNLERIYSELKAGNPVLVYRVNCSGHSDHWSVIVSYEGSTSTLQESGFMVYNTQTSWTYSVQNLTEWKHSGTIKHLKVRGTGIIGGSKVITLGCDDELKKEYYSGTCHFSAHRNDSDSNHHLQWFIDDVAISQFQMADKDGWFSIDIDTTKYSNGSHKLSVEYCNTQSKWTDSATITIKNNADTTKPTIKNAKITNLSPTGYTVECEVTDNVGVAKVVFPTWTEKYGQDDLDRNWSWNAAATSIKGNIYYFNVKITDHNNESGLYNTHIYAYDAAGNYVIKGMTAIVPLYISQISLSRTSAEMKVGEQVTISATITPSDATDKTIIWSSSDTKVATVDTAGKVTAIGEGSAVITAKAKDAGGKSATCSIKVVKQDSVVKGDLTGDGEVAMVDVVKVARAVGGYITLTPEEVAAADVTGDGEVAMGDVVKIARYVGGYIDSL